ncbi:MAG: radical SAM family heme chaperone HemW [Rhodospirillales bacterium]|nr:radical SAM family heme chaperone HemW [Rhodospirillales bacterium]
MGEAEPSSAEAPPALALYVHWPFCLSKCPYCDFNSHVRESVDQAAWRGALLRELDHYAALLPGAVVASVFFGGGTPSLMPPETAAAVIERAAARWSLAADTEITLEANPTSTEAARLEDFHAAGVNRVSLGVQALDDDALSFLGRGHDAAEARAAVALAQRIMPRSSFDLIYARPGQTVDAWRAELADALAFAGDHLSLYQLTIEKGTPFWRLERDGAFDVPDDDTARALYDLTQEMTAAAGFAAYEVSNHARGGNACRHNLAYWRYDDYVGIGPGAHGRIRPAGGARQATRQHAGPETWLAAIESAGHGTAETRTLDTHEQAREMLMMGLRLAEGVSEAHLRERTGCEPDRAIDRAGLARLIGAGYLECRGSCLKATAAGRPLLNSLLAELLA